MSYLTILAESMPEWFHELIQPPTIPFVIAFVAIVGGITLAVAKAYFRHRERIAKIEHGMDPDAKSEPT